MTKARYRKLLQNPKWKAKRKRVLKRDGYKCKKCNAIKYLHVHHKYYLENKLPWEVPMKALITLCYKCHKKEHKGKKITDFIKKR